MKIVVIFWQLPVNMITWADFQKLSFNKQEIEIWCEVWGTSVWFFQRFWLAKPTIEKYFGDLYSYQTHVQDVTLWNTCTCFSWLEPILMVPYYFPTCVRMLADEANNERKTFHLETGTTSYLRLVVFFLPLSPWPDLA